MSKKSSFVTEHKWPVPEYKRRGRRKYRVQSHVPGIVTLRVGQEVCDFEASVKGFNEFLRNLFNGEEVIFKIIGHRQGQLVFARGLLGKVKQYYKKIRSTASRILHISKLDLCPV